MIYAVVILCVYIFISLDIDLKLVKKIYDNGCVSLLVGTNRVV